MHIGELARRIERSVDTIKRWEDQGLLKCQRDSRGRRVYDNTHVKVCVRLAELGLIAQKRSEKLRELAASEPAQLRLFAEDARLPNDDRMVS